MDCVTFQCRLMCTEHVPSKSGTPYDIRCQRVDSLRERLREPREEPGNQSVSAVAKRSSESSAPSHRSASAATLSRRAGVDVHALCLHDRAGCVQVVRR